MTFRPARLIKGLLLTLSVMGILWLLYVASLIWSVGHQDYAVESDCIIVLGAAIVGNKPSPVFEERINHAVTLFHQGKAPKIIFTGGFGNGELHTESEVGAAFASVSGVPNSAILIEKNSRTTRQNLLEANVLMDASGFESAIIVSDPLHMKRAVMMAQDLGISAVSSPTPTTRYRSLKTKLGFLVREIYFYNYYLLKAKPK